MRNILVLLIFLIISVVSYAWRYSSVLKWLQNSGKSYASLSAKSSAVPDESTSSERKGILTRKVLSRRSSNIGEEKINLNSNLNLNTPPEGKSQTVSRKMFFQSLKVDQPPAKETKFQDYNYVNLDRWFEGADDKSRSRLEHSGKDKKAKKVQDESEIERFLQEINEEVEDLTTAENLQFFEPELDDSLSSKKVSSDPIAPPTKSTNAVARKSSSAPFKSGFVSIIGNPNVGKSTLMNFLLKQKLSIVSSKPQTTRHKIYGILTEEKKHQIVFVDTPGMLYQNKAAYTLHEAMQSVIRYAAMDADVLLLITDVFGDELQDEKIINRLQRAPYPVIIVVNKIDLLPEISEKMKNQPDELKQLFSYNQTLPKLIHPNIKITRAKLNESNTLESIQEKWKSFLPNAEVIPVSAAYNLGVTELLQKIVSYLKPGPKYYPSDYVSDKDERFFTSEIIRESIFESFEGEIPYCCEVFIEDFRDVNDGFSRITATIFVNRKSQVSILVGKEGNKIKELGSKAREKLEQFLERKVHLDLQVKNEPDWRSNKESLKKFGYIEDE